MDSAWSQRISSFIEGSESDWANANVGLRLVKRKTAERNANNLFCIMNISLCVVRVCKEEMNSKYNY
jgi:hypothetical protein